MGVAGGGAAGGLAGALAALGGRLLPGFELVADELELFERIEQADLVVTGEGFIDEQSFDGKVVGGVAEMASSLGVPVLAVAGEVFDGEIMTMPASLVSGEAATAEPEHEVPMTPTTSSSATMVWAAA